MYKYKRGINEVGQMKQLEYSLSNNEDTCLCMTGCLEAKKPYHGLYIKDGKIILENIMEEIEIKDKVYKLGQISTSVQNIDCDEYLSMVDLEQNRFVYDVDLFHVTKELYFAERLDTLLIEYELENRYTTKAKFRILPLITYRDLFRMKTSQMLRLNQRAVKDGTMINLSIVKEENVVLTCCDTSYTKEARYIGNVKHDYIHEDLRKEIFTEDLLIPGDFEVVLRAGESKKICLCISSKEITITPEERDEIKRLRNLRENRIQNKIEKEFVELIDLSIGISRLSFEGGAVSSLPYLLRYDGKISADMLSHKEWIKETISNLTEMIKAVDGAYLTFDYVQDANMLLQLVQVYLYQFDQILLEDEEIFHQLVLLKLWYIETINKTVQKQEQLAGNYIDSIKDILYDILSPVNQKRVLDDIEVCALCVNAIKIYENMLSKMGREDAILYDISLCIQNLISHQFWCEEKRTMRRKLADEKIQPCIEMIYTLSLSYPCIVGDIPIKLLDTIFKELYTPYGLRCAPKGSADHVGLIYPKYMAHFIKANLRQNGVTRASQKIAYNLVKELIQDISKHVNGGVKTVYHEKGYQVDYCSYDLLTNAEVIRLYDMLT